MTPSILDAIRYEAGRRAPLRAAHNARFMDACDGPDRVAGRLLRGGRVA